MTPNSEDSEGEYWDPWEALNLGCCSYNGSLDIQAVQVLCGIRDKLYCSDIAEKYGMTPEHVELWQGIFCSNDWAEYGTSPRGCFPYYGSAYEDLNVIIDAWKTYYLRMWEEKFPDDRCEGTPHD